MIAYLAITHEKTSYLYRLLSHQLYDTIFRWNVTKTPISPKKSVKTICLNIGRFRYELVVSVQNWPNPIGNRPRKIRIHLIRMESAIPKQYRDVSALYWPRGRYEPNTRLVCCWEIRGERVLASRSIWAQYKASMRLREQRRKRKDIR